MTDAEDLPITRLYKLQADINKSVSDKEWERVSGLARDFIKAIPTSVDARTCGTIKPHLDGIYVIGTIRYSRAPDGVRKSLNLMNRIIKSAKRSLK
jgi:hypothetical protein